GGRREGRGRQAQAGARGGRRRRGGEVATRRTSCTERAPIAAPFLLERSSAARTNYCAYMKQRVRTLDKAAAIGAGRGRWSDWPPGHWPHSASATGARSLAHSPSAAWPAAPTSRG